MVCPVLALQEWLAFRGAWSGPLLTNVSWDGESGIQEPMKAYMVNEVVKRALKSIGVDPEPYGAHSLRSSMITAAARNGAPLPEIQDRSGHASLQVLMGYIRDANLFVSNPLAGAL